MNEIELENLRSIRTFVKGIIWIRKTTNNNHQKLFVVSTVLPWFVCNSLRLCECAWHISNFPPHIVIHANSGKSHSMSVQKFITNNVFSLDLDETPGKQQTMKLQLSLLEMKDRKQRKREITDRNATEFAEISLN